MKKIVAKDVGEYIKMSLPEAQPMLRELRKIILATVPGAEERLGYGMPYYRYHGRFAYFAGFQKHVSFFPGDSKTVKAFARDLKKYETSAGTIKFPFGTKIPATLIKKILKSRMKDQEAKAKKKPR